MNLYSQKGFWEVTLTTDFTDNTAIGEFFDDNFTALKEVSRFPLDSIILNTIQRELIYHNFYLFSEEDFTDLEVIAVLQQTFNSNYIRALQKYPYLLALINQRDSLLTNFGTTVNSSTISEANIDARVSTSKQNDTPQSGNIDVSSDTYLSSIVKTSSDSAVDIAEVTQATTNIDNVKLLEFLNKEINTQVEGFRKIILDNCEFI